MVAMSQLTAPGPLLLMRSRDTPEVGGGWIPRVSMDKGPNSHTHSCLTHPPYSSCTPGWQATSSLRESRGVPANVGLPAAPRPAPGPRGKGLGLGLGLNIFLHTLVSTSSIVPCTSWGQRECLGWWKWERRVRKFKGVSGAGEG